MPPTFTIRNAATGESFDFTPRDEMWLDMQALATILGIRVVDVIPRALRWYFERDPQGVLSADHGDPRRV